VKVYVKLACVVCIGALWRITANMAFCYLFWITTLVWVVRYIVRARVKGGLLVLLGITCNALVTSLNKGVMPSVGIPATFQPAAPIWNVSGKGQWLTLADQAALYRFSIGDMFLIAGVLMCLIETAYRSYNNSHQRGSLARPRGGRAERVSPTSLTCESRDVL
jgi:hypothetical protein